MKPYYQDEWVTQYCSDALTVLSELESDTVDLLCSDPPYGISFMSKDWDKALPDKRIWAECLRVLKPGAFAFVMSIPRADCLSRMIISLEDAGFRVDFSPIYWAYASGFPKAQNISLAIDKQECRKQLIDKLGRSPTKEEFDKAWKGFREVVGKYHLPNGQEWNLEQADNPEVAHAKPTFTASGTRTLGITAPSTPQAKALDGSYGGFQPKPAVEVIIVAMKPMSEKTFVDQALKNGKGVTWLDDCRVPYESEGDKGQARPQGKATSKIGALAGGMQNDRERNEFEVNQTGRFPANLLVSDDVLNDGRVSKSPSTYKRNADGFNQTAYGEGMGQEAGVDSINYGDSGSFSRYFDLDSWTKKAFGTFSIHPEVDYLDAALGNEYENNIAYNNLLYGVSQLYHILGTALDWDALCSSFYNDLHPNETLDVRIEKALQDFQGDYLSSFHLDDVRAHLALTTAPNFLQLLDDVHKHNLDCLRKGDWGNRHDYNDHQNWTLSFLLSCLLLPTIIVEVVGKVKLNTDQMPESVKETFPFLICAKASKSEKNKGCEDLPSIELGHNRFDTCENCGGYLLQNPDRPSACKCETPIRKHNTVKGNIHPTCKPLKLMSYLITLGSRPGDVVLDPFGGSGTTALASKLLGRHCIISEIEERYCEISAKRLRQSVMRLE